MYEGMGKLAACTLAMNEINRFNECGDKSDFDMSSSFNFYEGMFQMGSLEAAQVHNYAES